MTLLLVTLATTGGYLLGRTRPLSAARDWARWVIAGYGPQTTPRQLAALALLPGELWHAWRHRHDPPPAPVQTPQLGEKWQNILNERDDGDA